VTAPRPGLLLRAAIAAALLAGLVAQALLQRPLGAANAVRGTRGLEVAPSSLAFRLAAGGVKEAAGDALWLTVLPRLGRTWEDPERKAAWIESVTRVMVDANPRAHFPLIYATYFLELVDRAHPGIERLLVHGMEIEKRGAFGRRHRPNEKDWDLPMELGMNLVLPQNGRSPDERARGLLWLERAGLRPDCPTIVADFVKSLRAREGDPLFGWRYYLQKMRVTENPDFQRAFLREADAARLAVLRRWAWAAEGRLGRWPRTLDEALAEAPEAAAAELRDRPELREALLEGVVLHPSTRDVEIPSLTEARVSEGLERLRFLARAFENSQGRRARSFRELQATSPTPIPPAPLHGTRWEVDPATGEPAVVPDLADPRLRR
jgi:hypothetical protein